MALVSTVLFFRQDYARAWLLSAEGAGVLGDLGTRLPPLPYNSHKFRVSHVLCIITYGTIYFQFNCPG